MPGRDYRDSGGDYRFGRSRLSVRAVAIIGRVVAIIGWGGRDYRDFGGDYRPGLFALKHTASGRSRLSVSGGDSCGVTISDSYTTG